MKGAEVNLHNKNAELNGNNVKPEIFACPLLRDLSKFVLRIFTFLMYY